MFGCIPNLMFYYILLFYILHYIILLHLLLPTPARPLSLLVFKAELLVASVKQTLEYQKKTLLIPTKSVRLELIIII